MGVPGLPMPGTVPDNNRCIINIDLMIEYMAKAWENPLCPQLLTAY